MLLLNLRDRLRFVSLLICSDKAVDNILLHVLDVPNQSRSSLPLQTYLFLVQLGTVRVKYFPKFHSLFIDGLSCSTSSSSAIKLDLFREACLVVMGQRFDVPFLLEDGPHQFRACFCCPLDHARELAWLLKVVAQSVPNSLCELLLKVRVEVIVLLI